MIDIFMKTQGCASSMMKQKSKLIFVENQKTFWFKAQLYTQIYHCLKPNGYFINGDTVCRDKDTEIKLRNEAEEIYKRQELPFGSIHIDVPLALDTEFALLSGAGFNNVSLERRWNKTALMKAIK